MSWSSVQQRKFSLIELLELPAGLICVEAMKCATQLEYWKAGCYVQRLTNGVEALEPEFKVRHTSRTPQRN